MDLKRGTKLSAEGSMSSMTDLVFLLLIFFVILSTFAREDQAIKVDTPSGKSTEVTRNDAPVISIEIKNGIHRVYVGKKEFTYIDRENHVIDKDKLASTIRPLLDEKSLAVEVNADRKAMYDYVAQVIDMVKLNKWKIALTYAAK